MKVGIWELNYCCPHNLTSPSLSWHTSFTTYTHQSLHSINTISPSIHPSTINASLRALNKISELTVTVSLCSWFVLQIAKDEYILKAYNAAFQQKQIRNLLTSQQTIWGCKCKPEAGGYGRCQNFPRSVVSLPTYSHIAQVNTFPVMSQSRPNLLWALLTAMWSHLDSIEESQKSTSL